MTGGGYRDEDVQFKQVSGPDDYGRAATGPVRYVVVANADGVLGYLWASDADDAAGFEPVAARGADAINAGGSWKRKLRPSKAEGLPPSAAIMRLDAGSAGDRTGRIVSGSEGTAPSLAVLRQLATG